jgi:hypothetical protein
MGFASIILLSENPDAWKSDKSAPNILCYNNGESSLRKDESCTLNFIAM